MQSQFARLRRHRFAGLVVPVFWGALAGLAASVALHFAMPDRFFPRHDAPVAAVAPAAGSAAAAPSAMATAATPAPAAAMPAPVRVADFGSAHPSPDVRVVANWVLRTHDAGDAEFVMVDKKNALVYVFDANGRLQGSSPVLLGAARTDDTVPGIGTRPLNQVRPEERTTPAGRFLAERGHNAIPEDVVWVDYDAAVSMHRVRTTNPAEHRLERLATPTIADNRISWGCINVPVAFYEQRIAPIFAARKAFVYVLPEVKTLEQVFGISPAMAQAAGGAPPARAAL